MSKQVFNLSLIVILLTLSCSKKEEPVSKGTLNKELLFIEVDLQVRSKKIPGIQLIYVKGSEVFTYTKGVKNTKTNEPIDDNTVFQAASMSKPLAAYVFLKQVEKGVLSLDVPLSQYYEYPRLVKNANNLSVTARQCLLHTAGFPNWTSVKNGPLDSQFAAGSKYYYSGEGFEYLQHTIEHLTGKSLNQLAEEEVFKPFGMNRSAFYKTSELDGNRTDGHDGDALYTTASFTSADQNSAFSLLTTAKDYAKFIQKVYIEKVGLSEKMFNDMVSLAIYIDPKKTNVGRGLGIGIQYNEKGISYYHGGSNPGYRSFHMVYPQDKEFFVYLTNTSSGYDLRIPYCELFFGSNLTQPVLE